MSPMIDDLVDVFTNFNIDLARSSSGLEAQIDDQMQLLREDLARKVEKADLAGAVRTATQQRRHADLVRQVDGIIKREYKDLSKWHQARMLEVAKTTDLFTSNALNRVYGANVVQPLIAPGHLREIVKDSLIEGAPSRDWWAKQSVDLRDRFTRETRLGMLSGETNDQIVRRIRGTSTGKVRTIRTAKGKVRRVHEFTGGVMDVSTRNAKALVRTSVQTVANNVQLETYQENQDVLKGHQALVTLDGRTTKLCISRSGAAWDFDGNPLPESPVQIPFPGPPPWHYNCRSVLIPITKSWDELLEEVGGQVDSPKNDPSPDRKLTGEERRAVEGALEDDLSGHSEPFPEVDRYVRAGRGRTITDSTRLEEAAGLWDSALAKRADAMGKPLYIGDELLQLNTPNVAGLRKGAKFTHNGYLRASGSKAVAMEAVDRGGFANRTVFKIRTTRSTRSLNLTKEFGRPGPDTYLLPRNEVLRVRKRSVVKSPQGHDVNLIEVDVVTPRTSVNSLIRKMRDIPEATRASMNGQVAGNMNYAQWLETQPEAFQRRVLGPGRYKLWKENKISLGELADQSGRTLTLDELDALWNQRIPRRMPDSVMDDFTVEDLNDILVKRFGVFRKIDEVVGAVIPEDAHHTRIALGLVEDRPGKPVIRLTARGEGISMVRNFKRVGSKLVVANDYIRLGDALRGRGLGTRMFAQQVKNLKRLGVDRIECLAARDELMNGYYTWARLGYDGKLPDSVRALARPGGRRFTRVGQIMDSRGGADWWRQYGDDFQGVFDLSDNSRSMRVLRDYLRKRGMEDLLK